MKRALAACLVLGAVTITWSSVPGPHITIGPPAIAVRTGPGSSSLLAHNDGTQGVAVSGIGVDPSCSMTHGAGITASFLNFPTNMFSFAVADDQPLTLGCPSTGPSPSGNGIRRCQFFVKKDDSPSGRMADFTQICLYQTAQTLTAMPVPMLFGSVAVGGGIGTATVSIMSTAGTSGFYYSIADNEANYSVTSPCLGRHCFDSLAIAPGGSRAVTVTCTPTRAGNLDTVMHVVSADGGFVMPIPLQCNGTAVGGEILLSQETVTLAQRVESGPITTNVTLKNDDLVNALEISSIVPAGSTSWGVAISGPCNTIPCTIPAGGMVSMMFAFDPSAIGPDNATLTINSNDADEAAKVITLNGTGQGTTLVLVSNIGTPPVSIGSGPVGSPLTRAIRIKNAPATEPLGVTIGVTNQPTFNVSSISAVLDAIGTEHQITVTCTPQALGTASGLFTVSSMASFNPNISFAVECTGTTGNLSVTPTAIALGDVRIGSAPNVQPVHLSTNGPTLTITNGPTESPNLPHVTLGPVSSQTIVMGPGSDFSVTFDPGTVEGPVSSMINVTASGQMGTVSFSANVVKAELDAPDDVDFGSLCAGKPVSPRTLRLVSTGSATIHMAQRPELEMMASSPFTLSRLSPGDGGYPTDLATNDEATVQVVPKPLPAGSYVDHVAWMTDATSPRTKVEVDFVDDRGGISPGAVSFGMAPVRQSAEPQTVTIQNCAAGTLMLQPPVFEPAGEFIALTQVPMMLAPGETAEVTLAFTPAMTGLRTATMTVATSSGDLAVDLSGTGLGDNSTHGAPASLYACDCASSDPVNGFVIILALGLPLIPRRRRR